MVMSIKTPTLLGEQLSEACGTSIYLKLENLQPTGSFKDRGVGHLCEYLATTGVSHFVSSSGGNAGLSAAYAGKSLGIPTTVVAMNAISEEAETKIKGLGATVVKGGETWSEVHEIAQKVAQQKGYAYIHPFEHQLIWDGYANIVKEIAEAGIKPKTIILSVGGGGLLSGICQGLRELGWNDTKILAVETKGAASFNAATKAGHLVTLEKITSIATTLGATRVAQEALDCYERHPIESVVVTDKMAVDACWNFARDHRLLVEPSCGAALSLVYSKGLEKLGSGPCVVIVCGGSGISCRSLLDWKSSIR